MSHCLQFEDCPIGRKYFPELFINGQLDIHRINVGFRPARTGGVSINKYKAGDLVVVNCYGFAGSGMKMSWGGAQRAISLLFANKSKL